jgi:hypothetical protein
MRILIAGLLGGLAMFIWSSAAHMSPLGRVGISTLPDESATVANLASAIGDHGGLYLFPVDMSGTPSSATAPGGFLAYNPHAPMAMLPGNLIVEFLTETVEAILAAWLLAQTALAAYAMRVGFVTVVGIVGAITTNVPYWNWYTFPTAYTLCYAFIEVVGYLVAGLAIAWYLKPKAA